MTQGPVDAGRRRLVLCGGLAAATGSLPVAAGEALQAALAAPQRPPRHPERCALLGIAQAGGRAVAVGEHGVVALSDNGRQWRNGRSGTDVTLTQVRFADARTGWAIGHLGVVLRTDDGGETWQRQRQGGQPDLEVTAERPWLDLLVLDAQRLVLVGAFGQALHSGDGGRSWASFAHRLPNRQGLHLYGLAPLDDGRLVIVGEQGLMLRGGLDTGAPFEVLPPVYEGSLFGITRAGTARLIAYGLRGNAFAGDATGQHWTTLALPGATATLNAAAALQDGRRVALCDQAGRVYLSEDGGARFQPLPSGGPPATGVIAPEGRGLILSTLGGIVTLPLPQPSPPRT